MKTTILFLLAFLPVAALAQDQAQKTSVGGYGELHLNYSRPSTGTAAAPILDFHRWILFVNHQWTDQWSLASELEVEHNFIEGGKASGEVELEQAYVQFRSMPQLVLQAGVLLPSVGLLNERHEPNLFLSVERPVYNNAIIPTTWFGNGLAARGFIANSLQYSAVIMEGLDDRKFKAKDGIRSGRLKGFKASLETVLLNPAIEYVGIPGLIAGTSLAINVLAHDPSENHPYSSTVLWELHAQYKAKGFWTQFEYGTISYSANTGSPADTAAILSNSAGWYADLGYNLVRLWEADVLQLYPFIRYTQFNPADKLSANGTTSQFVMGAALLPIEKVALKADYGIETKKGSDGSTGLLNIGIGYAF